MGYIWKALEKGYLEHPGLHAVLTTFLRFSSILDGACVPCCPFLSTGNHHVCIQIYTTCCCFPRCTTIALGAQKTPDPENLQLHPGFVWVKSGYSETIAWRKVRLTKQRNVDLNVDN